ncbi:MAG: MFS transporter [Pseudomonadota bacterium]
MNRLQLRMILLVATMLVLSALLLSWLALRHFERSLPPEMARTVTSIGYSVAGVLEKAGEHGMALTDMVGVDEFLAAVRKDNPTIVYLVLTDTRGRPLYQDGSDRLAEPLALQRLGELEETGIATRAQGAYFDTAMPLTVRHVRIGTLHLGQRTEFVEQKLQEVGYDVLTVLVVAGLIALELLRFVLTFVIATPIEATRHFLAAVRQGDLTHYLPFDRLGGIGQLSANFNRVLGQLNLRYQALQRHAGAAGLAPPPLAGLRFHAPGEHRTLYASALDHIRWPFFLLIFADSLSLSFFPVFVGQFYSPAMGLSRNIVIGLPISVFMFTWALSMPWAGMWSDRVGHRRAFAVGAAVTTAGLILTASAHSLYDLLLWRSLTALGYGLVFITAQGYVTNVTPPAQRTRGMAVFLSSFFAGSLSGSAIGGILADRLGYQATILLSALLSAASALFVLRFLHHQAGSGAAPRRQLRLGDFQRLLQNRKFAAITFLAAVPAKIALTGFLYYAVPLYLKFLGNSQSATGRVMMAYGLAIIVLSPWAAKLADRYGALRWFVSVGGYASAAAMFLIHGLHSTAGLLLSITLLGMAHAVGVSPQLALINDFCKDVVQEVGAGTATGIFRLIERFGNVLGPVIAGLLIAHYGFDGAFLGIGTLCLLCASAFTVLFIQFERHRLPPAQLARRTT